MKMCVSHHKLVNISNSSENRRKVSYMNTTNEISET